MQQHYTPSRTVNVKKTDPTSAAENVRLLQRMHTVDADARRCKKRWGGVFYKVNGSLATWPSKTIQPRRLREEETSCPHQCLYLGAHCRLVHKQPSLEASQTSFRRRMGKRTAVRPRLGTLLTNKKEWIVDIHSTQVGLRNIRSSQKRVHTLCNFFSMEILIRQT